MSEKPDKRSASGGDENHEAIEISRPSDAQEDDDNASLRRMLRRMHDESDVAGPAILPGVQRKIRERSRGRFYRDGWSTQQTRTSTYVVSALLLLTIVGLVYFVLVPGVLGPK